MKYVKYVITFIIIIVLVYEALILMDVFTPQAFSLLSAFLIAGIFERFKWIKTAWDELTSDTKQLFMVAFLAVLTFGAFGLSCANVVPAFQCTWPDGLFSAAVTFVLAVGINQGTYSLAQRKSGTLPTN